jgi:hypothetical protein
MRKHRIHTLALLAGLLFSLAASAIAPNLVTIMPRGIPRGVETEVTLVGDSLADSVDVLFHDPGIELVSITPQEDGKTAKAVLRVAPDCPVGSHGLRVRTKTGVSILKVISVGALAEIQESEPNNKPEESADVAMGTTVNGVVTSEDVDYFTVTLNPGDRIAVEVEALRLGDTLFDPKLRLFGPEGHERVSADDTQLFKQDAGFIYSSTETGKHHIVVSEAAYGGGGNFYYRLHIGQFPRPLAVSPMGGAPGTDVQLTWLGDSGTAAQTVKVPENTHGVIQLAAMTEAGIAPTSLPFRASTLPGVLEVEPNNGVAEATPGAAAGAFDGVIGAEGDVDFFKFDGKTGQVFDVRIWARALGSPLDSVLVVHNPDGSALGSDDDAAAVDSKVRVTLPADGTYLVSVRDHLNRGGDTFSYRIEATAVEPMLTLSLLENRPVTSVVPKNNYAYLLANVTRQDFDGPIKVELLGLPEGVTASSPVIPAGQALLPIILHATPEAAAAGALVDVRGTLQQEGSTLNGGLEQEVRLIPGNNDTTFFGRMVDKLAVAVSEPAPFSVELVPPTVPTVINTYRMLTIKATRAEGFNGPIDLRFPWLPGGMGGGTAQIPPDQTETQIRLEVRPGTAIQVHELFVAAVGGGYELCTAPAPVEVQDPWVNFNVASVETEKGKPVEMVVTVEQKVPYEGTFQAQILGLPNGITVDPLPFTKDTTELKFTVNVTPEAPVGKFEGLLVDTTINNGAGEVIHRGGAGALKVYEPLPATLQAAAPPPPPAEGAPAAPVRKTRFPAT